MSANDGTPTAMKSHDHGALTVKNRLVLLKELTDREAEGRAVNAPFPAKTEAER